MIRVGWEHEEAVALYSLYIVCGYPIPKERLSRLSYVLNIRAEKLGIKKDEKFRNLSGLNMQSACIHYIVTKGRSGLSSQNRLFNQIDVLYNNDREKFDVILKDFVDKYGDI